MNHETSYVPKKVSSLPHRQLYLEISSYMNSIVVLHFKRLRACGFGDIFALRMRRFQSMEKSVCNPELEDSGPLNLLGDSRGREGAASSFPFINKANLFKICFFLHKEQDCQMSPPRGQNGSQVRIISLEQRVTRLTIRWQHEAKQNLGESHGKPNKLCL